MDAAPCELRPVLQLGEQVGQVDVGLIENDSRRPGGLGGLHARLTDGNVGLAPLQPGLGDCRRVPQRGGAFFEQSLVVEGHAVGGLVLDAVPTTP